MLTSLRPRKRTRFRDTFYGHDRQYRQPLRLKVRSHLIDNHRPGDMCLLSLPGIGWPSEKLIRACVGPSLKVVGLEQCEEVVGAVAASAPDDIKTELVHTTASDFLRQDPKRWDPRFDGFTALWLDFTSNISPEIVSCCRHLTKWLRPGPVPFAITFANGREADGELKAMITRTSAAYGTAHRRATVLTTILSAHCRLASHAEVVAFNGIQPMGCLFGVLNP